MTETAFNLVDEPWIRVLETDGAVQEVSLRDALLRAHTFSDLGGELQTQNIAVLRLLLAVLHTVFSRVDETGVPAPLTDPNDALSRWIALWSRGSLPEEPLVQYLNEWHERFWLFHPTRPFGQSQAAREGTKCKAAKLIGEISQSENKPRLFSSRAGWGKERISYAEAARWLVYLNGFDDAALKPHIPKEEREAKITPAWLGQLGLVYARGDNLFETLLLNLTLLRPDGTLWGENRPAWEQKTPRSEELRTIPLPDNQAELLTLQSRLIWLMREDSQVTEYGILCGDSFSPQNALSEQMTAWTKVEKKNEPLYYIPRPHEPGRQMWRDFSNLFALNRSKSADCAPGIVWWVARLQKHRCLSKKRYVQFAAVCNRYDSSQKSAVTDALGDMLTMHTALLGELGTAWQNRIEAEIAKCEEAAKEIGLLASRIDVAGGGDIGSAGKKKQNDRQKRVKQIAQEKWYEQIDEPFRRWLYAIEPENHAVDEKKMAEWTANARRLALHTGWTYMENAGTDALFGKTVVEDQKTGKKQIYAAPRAYSWFRKRIYEIYQGRETT